MLDYRTHTFLEVYRQGSFTLAAKALLVTQPAVSQQIRQLESHYGCRLFTRSGRSAAPTPAAHLLYRQLSAAENDERRLRLEAAALAKGPPEPAALRLGCTRTVADFAAPPILSRYLARHPDTRISMHSGNTHELVEALVDGNIDVALVEGSFDRERFDSEVFSREAYIAIAAAGSMRARSVEDLLDRRLILREQGSGTREILEKNLAARDLAIEDFADTLEMGSIPAIKACVQTGCGISFLYRIAVERELADGNLADVTPVDFRIGHDFRLIWQRGSLYAERYRALAAQWRALRGGA